MFILLLSPSVIEFDDFVMSLPQTLPVYVCIFSCLQFARLFAKLPRPGDSEVTFAVFKSSCHLLLPV